MRIFTIDATLVTETFGQNPLAELSLPQRGYLWITCTRARFELMQAQIQAALQTLCGVQLLDLHISDLLNQQLPSRYDYTSQYDLLVQQVRDMQIKQLHTTQGLQYGLDLGLHELEARSRAGDPQITPLGQDHPGQRGRTGCFSDQCAVDGENSHRP